LQNLAVEVSRLIYHLIESVKTEGFRGQKYKKTYKSFREEINKILEEIQKEMKSSDGERGDNSSQTKGTSDT
jgi:hypothetical protein